MRHRPWLVVSWGAGLLLLVACGAGDAERGREGRAAGVGRWALAIHGGAGVPRESVDATRQREYLDALERAL
ncbi:MAG TPA: hypothetical protein VD788_05980, partial [Candidatus Polarisedimenticolaceae bacterium]|nr:hypothetical protein [Candidatus Polarisedimenticolaceae bacterium]